MSTVTFNGLRIDSAEAATGWANFVGGGPAPAAEPQLKYQGSLAVNRKVASTSDRRGVQYSYGSTIDMTNADYPLWLVKLKVGDAADLNTTYGCEVTFGSSSGNRYSYNVSGTGANNDKYITGYDSQGGIAEGYLITAVNPNVTLWREGQTGTPNLASVAYFAIGAQFITGGAKSENVACDSIDVGFGLDYNGTLFSFEDAPDEDQDIIANRWGFACRNGPIITLRGMQRIGPTSITSGTDISQVIIAEGYHDTGDTGFDYNTSLSSVELNGTYTCLGRDYTTVDTRGTLTFTGDNTYSSTHRGTFDGWAKIDTTTGITFQNTIIKNSGMISPHGGIFTGGTIADSTAFAAIEVDSVAELNAVTNTRFTNNTGHSIQINTAGTYTFTDLFFEGGGVAESLTADIFNNSGGLVTINVTGGSAFTLSNSALSTTVINNVSTLTITGIPNGLEARLRLGSVTIPDQYVASVTGGQVIFSYDATIYAGRTAIITIGGVADTLVAYERQDISIELPSENQIIPIGFLVNPSYQ